MGNVFQKMLFGISPLIALLFPQTVHAQGVLYVSNLGQNPTGSAAVSSDSWVAQTIVTGSSSAGYVLNAVQLLMAPAWGTPSGFAVSLYSKTGDPHSLHIPGDSPQSNLADLSGPDPAAGGIFNYSASGLVLSPSTFYFVVVAAATPATSGAYIWSAADTFTQSNGFTIDSSYFSSTNGSSWTWHPRQNVFLLGIYATTLPPPGLIVVTNGPASIKILWPNLGTYTLQQNMDLATTNWVTSSYPVTNNILTNFCTVAPTAGNLFFRLKL